ncbi:sensor histidine kinase [Halalkalibacter krulwichiae]|uniref:histidine kinase n=1 Tax=Halalkalibacter krulwichiae TaxID=199441 RepID=A0A1X9MCG3_9BACI|nr:ATP-binding protein [Halalkalibacter krulwichiae]ARK31135.1 Sensor histidine kinase YycG [Halalkalibacter krulwichiae]
MKRWTIKKKVWFSILLIAIIVTLGAISIVYFLYEKLYVDKQIEALMRQGEYLSKQYEQSIDKEAFFHNVEWVEEMLIADLYFTDDPMQLGSGTSFEPYADENLIMFEERQKLLEGETVVMVRTHPQFQQDILGVAIPTFQAGHLSGVVFLSMPLSDVHEPFKQVQTMLLVVLFLIVFIIMIIGKRVINHVVHPLSAMKKVAQKVAAGDYSQNINVEAKRGDELGQLARSFNRLSSSLEKADNNRREFLANVSHELRTPLSYMKGYTEAMQEGVVNHTKGLAIIEKEANRLERLVNDLLDLAQLEGESYPLTCEPIALAQLVSEVLEQYEIAFSKKKINLNCILDDAIIISGDRDRIEQVIHNVLDNALKFSPDNKQIHVTLSLIEKKAELLIEDEGIGIPEEDMSQIMERFYRVDKARTRASGGTGLGLAIVSEIMKKHQGSFSLTSKLGKGTKVKLLFVNIL